MSVKGGNLKEGSFIMPPQLQRSLGGILVWACPSVCPSVCYTCTRSRTDRDRILKFGM